MRRVNTSDKKFQIDQSAPVEISIPEFSSNFQLAKHYNEDRQAPLKPTKLYKDNAIDKLLDESERIFQNIEERKSRESSSHVSGFVSPSLNRPFGGLSPSVRSNKNGQTEFRLGSAIDTPNRILEANKSSEESSKRKEKLSEPAVDSEEGILGLETDRVRTFKDIQ